MLSFWLSLLKREKSTNVYILLKMLSNRWKEFLKQKILHYFIFSFDFHQTLRGADASIITLGFLLSLHCPPPRCWNLPCMVYITLYKVILYLARSSSIGADQPGFVQVVLQPGSRHLRGQGRQLRVPNQKYILFLFNLTCTQLAQNEKHYQSKN